MDALEPEFWDQDSQLGHYDRHNMQAVDLGNLSKNLPLEDEYAISYNFKCQAEER